MKPKCWCFMSFAVADVAERLSNPPMPAQELLRWTDAFACLSL
uniref:Uncharacterized protein n=1 Tax=Rhizophora mucronata TaxID=61149 RepID=A0A2P2PEV5_RHIMU